MLSLKARTNQFEAHTCSSPVLGRQSLDEAVHLVIMQIIGMVDRKVVAVGIRIFVVSSYYTPF